MTWVSVRSVCGPLGRVAVGGDNMSTNADDYTDEDFPDTGASPESLLDTDATGLAFPPPVGYVYALINAAWPGLVKIGQSGDLRARFNNYQTGDPHRAYMLVGYSKAFVDVKKLETAVHQHFGDFRVMARSEWFRVPVDDAVRFLAGLA